MDAFCELADEDKSKYDKVAPSHHGYVKPGDEKYFFFLLFFTFLNN